jgi:hypothetical protein
MFSQYALAAMLGQAQARNVNAIIAGALRDNPVSDCAN